MTHLPQTQQCTEEDIDQSNTTIDLNPPITSPTSSGIMTTHLKTMDPQCEVEEAVVLPTTNNTIATSTKQVASPIMANKAATHLLAGNNTESLLAMTIVRTLITKGTTFKMMTITNPQQ